MRSHSSVGSAATYDYIIVGAGTAGCVLADRLTEDAAASVLLLEAGPSDDSLDAVAVPALFGTTFESEMDWNYELELQRYYRGSNRFPRGKGLGGSSSINLMIYIRGHRADFDGWAAAGNAGWDFDGVLPYFLKAEKNSRLGGPLHGSEGPVHVEDRLFTHELSSAWVDAAVEWGLPRNDDFNGETQLGVGEYQVTCRDGRRWSSADAYLRSAMYRSNLDVRVGAYVTRVIFDGDRATGVSYRQAGTESIVHAESEVILSGGVVNSPQLLLLSGVGPAAQLRALDIPVILDLPGVGENLRDHTMVPLIWGTRNSTDLLELASPESMALWRSGQGGPFASNGAEVGGFLSTNGDEVPNVQFLGGPTSFADHGRYSPPLPNFTMLTASTHPRSRGRIWLRSADPWTHPRINPNYFASPDDMRDITTGLMASLEIVTQRPLARYLERLKLPSVTPTDRSALERHARNWSQTEYHAVGTCSMGTAAETVVDPQLRVHGLRSLRVVDASVMPSLISGNTNAATVMIAEKAADLITAQRSLASDASR